MKSVPGELRAVLNRLTISIAVAPEAWRNWNDSRWFTGNAGTRRVLARANWQKLKAGRSADAVHSEALADADRAFALLRDGTGA